VANPDELLTLLAEGEEALSRFICAQMFRVQAFRDSNAAMRQRFLDHAKNMGRAFLERTEKPEDAEEIWRARITKPDEWWFKQEEPYQAAKTAASMLAEVQGFSNLLRSMPWQIGLVDSDLPLYTSDNPVSRHQPPLARWPGFVAFNYYVPLSPSVLLKIGPGFDPDGKGHRLRKDFSPWETSLARHLTTAGASRFVYGPGPYVSKACSRACLERLALAKVQDGERGFIGGLPVHELGYASDV